jgi:hypothetical protein
MQGALFVTVRNVVTVLENMFIPALIYILSDLLELEVNI